jgi:two-component system sensor histidine kinase KdpD
MRRESLPEQAFNDMIVSISEEAERLHHLVADLLAIARTELAVERRPVVIGDILRNVIGEFSTTHRRPIELSVAPDLPEALGDSSYLRQVVGNLLTNADKYTPIELPIEVGATRARDEVEVRVTDHGSGIDEEELPRIFESFFRGKDAGERASGSGLGLTVCRRLIESLGGRIWAKNRPEGGLEVGFTLKLAEASGPGRGNDQAMGGRAENRSDEAGATAVADEIVA